MKKNLPSEITSYDLLKTFALVTMVIDHVGYYFFPEEEAWRLVGRLSAPVWFFLIGYAQSRDLGAPIWAGLILLVAANLVVGFPVLPLNILATMIFIRLVIDPAMHRALRDYEALLGISLIAVFLVIPTMSLWEYGTAGVLFAMYGYMMRRPETLTRLPRHAPTVFIILVVALYVGFQSLLFGFDKIQAALFALGMLPVMVWLTEFRPRLYPRLTAALTPAGAGLVQLCGRYSLEFYVLHVILFKVMALWMGDDRFGWFDMKLFP